MQSDESKPAGPEMGGEASRLDAAAMLAGTVAHDLGNMLTVILGNAELLVEGLGDQPEMAECATLILMAAQKGTDLTERLDRLARRIVPPASPTDASAALAAIARRVEGMVPRGIAFAASVPEGLPGIWLTPAAIGLAVEELVRNALDALAPGGTLRLSAEEAGGRLRITVGDDGTGLAPETLRRVQEIGFTAGPAGHRTGVGLAVARRVAAAGSGSLRVESSLGAGTQVILDLATFR